MVLVSSNQTRKKKTMPVEAPRVLPLAKIIGEVAHWYMSKLPSEI